MSAHTTRRAAVAILATTASLWTRAQAPGQPQQLRIGFQKGSYNLALLKSYGLLEQRLPAHASSGPSSPPARSCWRRWRWAASSSAPPATRRPCSRRRRAGMSYVGAEPPKPDSSAVLVKPDSPLKTLADLKGRRIALQKGSSAHFLTVRAVKKAGLAWSDIQAVYLPPADARAAFERGSVDAWAVWDPYYAAAEVTGELRALATSRGLTSNNTFYLASRALSATRRW